MDEMVLGELLGDDLLGLESSGNQADVMGSPFYGIAGEDDYDAILGAALKAKSPQAAAALRQAIRNRKLKQSALVYPREPSDSNLQPLGFFQAAVPANTQVQVTTQPQTLFKPMRLLVPATIAPFFVVDDIKVGNVSQLPSSQPIPGEAFVQGGFGIGLNLKTVNPAIDLTLIVTNIGGAAADFRAAFFGVSVQ